MSSSRRATGTGILTDPGLPSGTAHMDTFTCAHCQTIVFLHQPDGSRSKDQGGFCQPCFKPVCGACADLGRCLPFEKKMEEYEKQMAARNRLLSSMGVC